MNWKTGVIFVLGLGLAAAWWMNRDAEFGELPTTYAGIEEVMQAKFEKLEAKLETRLPKEPGTELTGDEIELVLRPGPIVETPDGGAYDVEDFRGWAKDSAELCQEHGVMLHTENGVTYSDAVEVVDQLLRAGVVDIVFGAVEGKEGR